MAKKNDPQAAQAEQATQNADTPQMSPGMTPDMAPDTPPDMTDGTGAEGQAAEAETASETGAVPPASATAAGLSLLSLDELAMRYRVPSWQQAALARLCGWETGKRVTTEDYEQALDVLHARPQGGR